MLYGKIVEGVLIYAPPEIYDDNGVVTILKTPSDYYNNGYKIVKRIVPAYDSMTQILLLDNISEDDTNIYINYIVQDQLDYIIEEEANI